VFDVLPPEPTHVYESTLEEALTSDYVGEGEKDKTARTNIVMSMWTYKVFASIQDVRDLSLARVMARTIRLGTSIMQHDYETKLKDIAQGWASIRESKNQCVECLEGRAFSRFDKTQTRKMYVRYPVWCAETLGSMSLITQLRMGDLIQLAVCHAVATSTEIMSEWNHIEAQSNINKFELALMDTSEFLNVLAVRFGAGGQEEHE